MKTAALFLLTSVSIFAAPAVNVTGAWSGLFKIALPDGSSGRDGAYFILKQSGDQITGTAGQRATIQHPITSGKIEEDHIVLVVSVPDQGDFNYDLKLEGDHMKGNVEATVHGHELKATVDVERVKRGAVPTKSGVKGKAPSKAPAR